MPRMGFGSKKGDKLMTAKYAKYAKLCFDSWAGRRQDSHRDHRDHRGSNTGGQTFEPLISAGPDALPGFYS